MLQLSALEIQNWVALYAAAGLCCAFAVVLSIAITAAELHNEVSWESVKTVRGAIMFVSKTWWRWQKLYLCSAPATLAIVGSFAMTLPWS